MLKDVYTYGKIINYLVEFLGTLFFIYTILASGGNALIVGGSLAFLIFVFGGFSGGHFNPAVTLTMAVSNRLEWSDVAPYIVSQIAGGLVAIQLRAFHLYIVK